MTARIRTTTPAMMIGSAFRLALGDLCSGTGPDRRRRQGPDRCHCQDLNGVRQIPERSRRQAWTAPGRPQATVSDTGQGATAPSAGSHHGIDCVPRWT